MNKFSFGLNLILISIICFSWAKQKPVTPKSCNQVCMDYSNAGNYPLLNGNFLRNVTRNYQSPGNSTGIPAPSANDANAVWFGLNDLKWFIWEIENKVCNNPCSKLTTNDLGIRIYYGRYPDPATYQQLTGFKLRSGYEGLHTVFMVPTFNKGGNPDKHYDFLLNNQFVNKCEPATPPAGDVNFQIRALFPMTADGKNHGDLCPPDCEGAIFAK